MLHTDPDFPLTIGPDVTVDHHAILHGCTVGAGALIGMGATVLNGARIQAGCIVGGRWCTNRVMGAERRLQLPFRRCAATPACRAGSSG